VGERELASERERDRERCGDTDVWRMWLLCISLFLILSRSPSLILSLHSSSSRAFSRSLILILSLSLGRQAACKDPTIGLCVGPYSFSGGVGVSYERGTPLWWQAVFNGRVFLGGCLSVTLRAPPTHASAILLCVSVCDRKRARESHQRVAAPYHGGADVWWVWWVLLH